MEELLKISEFIMNYTSALKRGLDKFTGMLPVIAEQNIRNKASERLNTTRDEFLDAVSVKMENYLLVVEIDKDNWVANAVESGADPFNMKETHLRSPKARMSKPDKYGNSYKYLRIPIGKEAGGKPGKTDKSKELQEKINQVMMKPQYGMSRLKSMIDGTVVESQKVLTVDPDLSGMYRVRKFANPEEFHSGKKPQWQLVLFRTMSERPFTSRWDHPGIQPQNIIRDTDRWLTENIDKMLDTFLQNEVDKLGDI